MLFRPLSVLAIRLPSLLWGIDTGALYETWKPKKATLVSVRPVWSLRTPQAKAKLLG